MKGRKRTKSAKTHHSTRRGKRQFSVQGISQDDLERRLGVKKWLPKKDVN